MLKEAPYLVGAIFAMVHWVAPLLFRYRQRLEPQFSSLTGGFAIAYVCLELLPAMADHRQHFGERIYLFIFFGFAAFFGLEYCLHWSAKARSWMLLHDTSQLGLAVLYNVLLALALTREIPPSPWAIALFSVLIGFHLLSNDFSLLEANPAQFKTVGRFVLAVSIATGLGIHWISDPSEWITDTLAAWVAGTILYKVFRKELPDFSETHFVAFCGGGLFFIVTHSLIDQAELVGTV